MEIFIIFFYIIFNCNIVLAVNSPTTSTEKIRFFDSSGGTEYLTGNLGSRSTTSATCQTRANALSLACRETPAFLSYTGDDILMMSTKYKFSSNTQIVTTNGLNVGTWGTLFQGSGTTISDTLYNLGVFSSSSYLFWTGTNINGNVASSGNCNNWSSFSSTTTKGVANSNQFTFFANGGYYCSDSLNTRMLCMCIQGTARPTNVPTKSPTSSPTKKPTTKTPTNTPTTKTPTKSPTLTPTLAPSITPTGVPTTKGPTKSPTKSPSKTPTKAPTKPPTKNPTKSPTKFPTKSPTKTPTITPTKNPTKFPTYTPTKSPVIAEPIRYLYKLPQGSKISIQKNYNNITYSHLTSTPTNITVTSLTKLTAVTWTNLEYRIWNRLLNTTTTVTFEEPCNPGHPSEVPGEPTLQLDGVYTCPTTEKCILTNDCTDELAPYATYDNFPDLRACYCSYTETDYINAPELDISNPKNIQLYEGSMRPIEEQVTPEGIIGLIFCNNFIDREINCQQYRNNSNYVLQCQNEPIGCYDNSIGKFFGAFNTQNPKFQYPIEQEKWTLDLYKGVASLLNYKTYSTNGKYVDPFTSNLWNDYYWINAESSFEVYTAETNFTFSSYQTNLIQMDPHLYTLNNDPPPNLNNSASRASSTTQKTCLTTIKSGSFTTCTDITWANATHNNPAYHQAGVELTYEYPETHSPMTITVTINYTTSQVKGIEVYSAWNELCGSIYRDEGFLTSGEYFVFLCINTPSYRKIPLKKALTIRLIGLNSIYDIPGSTLSSEYLESGYDQLLTYLDTALFTPFLGNTWPLMLPLAYDFGYLTNNKKWPQRQFMNRTLIDQPFFNATYNYTIINTEAIEINSAWNDLSNQILNNNTYPENKALLNIESLYEVTAINYTSTKDLDYLYGIWEVWLAPRYCGADEVQCQTYQLGTCVIDSENKQRWYNGEKTLKKEQIYEFEGEEGGCLCYNTFQTGFFKQELFCQVCETGYGPNSLQELSNTLLYHNYIFPLYNETDNYFPITDITIEEFEEKYICKFPYGTDPVPASLASHNLCAGHGIISFETIETNIELKTYNNDTYIICEGLSISTFFENILTFELSPLVTSPFNLIYTSSANHNILTVIGTKKEAHVYTREGKECLISNCNIQFDGYDNKLKPWTCDIECPSSSNIQTYEYETNIPEDEQLKEENFKYITCTNTKLFKKENISLNFKYLKNFFLGC